MIKLWVFEQESYVKGDLSKSITDLEMVSGPARRRVGQRARRQEGKQESKRASQEIKKSGSKSTSSQ